MFKDNLNFSHGLLLNLHYRNVVIEANQVSIHSRISVGFYLVVITTTSSYLCIFNNVVIQIWIHCF